MPNAGYDRLVSNQVLGADDLGRAMVGVAVQPTMQRESRVFKNRDIRAMVASFHLSSE